MSSCVALRARARSCRRSIIRAILEELLEVLPTFEVDLGTFEEDLAVFVAFVAFEEDEGLEDEAF